jgi:hypothetical protein
MKETQCSGNCLGDLRLSPLDVGFDVRSANMPIELPAEFHSVGLDRNGQTWLIEGTREEMTRAIIDAGYVIADS